MDTLSPLPLSGVRLNGHVGDRLHAVLEARILSQHARTEIIGEALEAFRRRVDDRLRPGSGLWQGEFWGKWMLSAIAAQRYSGDAALRDTIASSCRELLETQDPDGYIGTYSDSSFVRSGEGGRNWNIWCRKYTLWGLIAAYELLGDARLLTAATRLMDHLAGEVGPGRTPIIETGQFCGLPSTSILLPVVRLFRHTGEQRHLDYAHYIVEQWGAVPGRPPDIVRKGLTGTPIHEWFPEPEKWTKAYEFISCVEGLVELYRVDGRREWLECAVGIHRLLREYERTIVGSIGKNDKLLASRYLLETEAEVCDAVYWQRLSTQLLRLTGDPLYADEIERTLYNVLCGAMNAEGTWGLRRMCLSGEHWVAPQHCDLKHHQCCVANLPRGLLQAAQCAVMARSDGLAVVLFVPGRYRLRLPSGQDVTVTIDTDYPRSGVVRLHIAPAGPARFTVAVRIPGWSEDAALRIAGEALPRPTPGAFAEVDRVWRSGDVLECALDLHGRLVPSPSTDGGARHVAVVRGPIVLARDIRLGDPDPDARVVVGGSGDHPVELTPIRPADGMWLAYRTRSGVAPDIALCDYASTGQTWDKATSAFRVWLPTTAPQGALLINGPVGAPTERGLDRVRRRAGGPVDVLHHRSPDDPALRDCAWVLAVEPLAEESNDDAGNRAGDAWAVEVAGRQPARVTIRAGCERARLFALYHVADCLAAGRPAEAWATGRRPLVAHRYAWVSAGNCWSPVCRPDWFDRDIVELPGMGFNGVILCCTPTHGTSIGRQTIPFTLTPDGVDVDRFKLPAFQGMLDRLKGYGLEVCLFHQAFVPPGFTKDDLRAHYDGRRDLPGLTDAIVASSHALAAALFEHLPQVDCLLFHSIECDWFWGDAASIFPCKDDGAGERAFDASLRGLTRACREHGKDLLFWTHVSGVSARQIRLMHRVLGRHPSVVVVEDAAWPNNCWPHVPVMGHVARDLQEQVTAGRFGLAVNCTDGEYYGAGALPTAYPDPFIRQARAAAELGAEYAFIRLNEQDLTPLGTLGDINAINVIAASEQWWEPARPTADLWRAWTARRFGAAAAPVVTAALQTSAAVITRGFSAAGMPLIDHSGLAVYSWRPGTSATAWDLFARPGDRLADKPYDDLVGNASFRAWQVEAHGIDFDQFLEGHAEAERAVHEALRLIERARADLTPEDADYLAACFADALPMLEAVRVTAAGARASGLCLRDPDEANRCRLAEACDAMDACADRIEAERGIGFRPVHSFMKTVLDGREYAGYGVPVALRVLAGIYRTCVTP